MIDVYLGLGSNVGDKRSNIAQALRWLASKSEVVAVSALYRTAPVGYLDQDWFLNGAAQLRSTLTPEELLGEIREIERRLDRRRTIINGPRTIDVDILYFGDQVVAIDDLEIPHPRLRNRRFVLVPLASIAPSFVDPRTGETMAELLAKCPDDGLVEHFDRLREDELTAGSGDTRATRRNG